MSDEDWYASNRAWWDARAPVHAASEFYGLEAFVADPGATTLRPFEVEEVGDVAGRALVHPQCHFGMDTLSWARRGAEVVGIDLSPAAVDAATGAADRAGLDATIEATRVYEWNHGLGEVLSAVLDPGFTIELFHEHDYTLFQRWPFLEKEGRDTYRLPAGMPSLPLMYSLRARKD